MDVKSDDDEVETKLDVEFRRILRIIKIYVPCIMNVDYLTSYRLWLEKLSEADITDKQDRNRYLIELCRQIQDGILEMPFKQRPLPGPLPPLKRNLGFNREQLQQQQQQQQILQQHQQQQQQQQLLQLQQQQIQQQQLQQQQLQQQHQQQQQLLQQQLQQQQLQQQKLQQQLQEQQIQEQQYEQQQLLQQHYFEDVIPVKQESGQSSVAKDLNRSNRPSTSRQEVPSYPDDSEHQSYLKGFSKSSQVQKEVHAAQDNVQKPKLIVLKNPPSSKPPVTSHKKRNQHTVLKEIQEHIRNSNKYRGQNNVLADLASKFPESPKQSNNETEAPCSYANTKQYEETQQRYLINDCCLEEKQQQNGSYQQQESQSPHSIYMTHQQDSFSVTEEVLKNTSGQSKITGMNLRITEDIGEESSWFDLSEPSRTATASRMESGDSANSLLPKQIPCLVHSNNSIDPSKIHEMCENKIKDLVDIVTELKKQNLSLNAKAEIIIQNLSDEINLLKLKEQKLNEMKVTTKKTHSVASAQWKSTVNDLKQTLRNAQEEIVTLQNEIIELKEKLEEFSIQKQQDNVTVRQRLADMYDKEIEMLKQNYVRHIVDIENKFTQILIEKEAAFNKKLNDLKEQYDKKISDITKGISEMSAERSNKSTEKFVGRTTVGKKTFISRNIPEKEVLDKSEKMVDEKRPWRKRLVIGSYKLNN